MDTPHWPQEPMEEILVNPNPTSSYEKKVRPHKDGGVNCPRCDSTNTKFCYYNNYSLSQPRFFCKTCRRYWTEGGTLRNIPVGGGSRKNKRSNSSSISNKLPAPIPQNPRVQDLNLGFPSTNSFKNLSEFMQAPNFDATKNTDSCASTVNATQLSALELLTGITRGGNAMNSFMPIPIPDPNSVYSPSGQLMIPMSEFKIPSLNFSLDGMASGGGGAYESDLHDGASGRLLFPFEDLKTNTTHGDPDHVEQSRDQNGDSNGFWNGMMGGGSWCDYRDRWGKHADEMRMNG